MVDWQFWVFCYSTVGFFFGVLVYLIGTAQLERTNGVGCLAVLFIPFWPILLIAWATLSVQAVQKNREKQRLAKILVNNNE